MVSHFATLGYLAIRADIQGYSRPDKIYWTERKKEAFIPDITCYKNDVERTPIVLEAEICESLGLEHSRRQWQLFSTHALNVNGEFHIVVPRVCKRDNSYISGNDLVKEWAKAWNVVVPQIWVPSQ